MQDRVRLIARMIDSSIRNPQETTDGRKYLLRDLVVREIVRGLPQHGKEYEDASIGAVFNWVKRNIEYRQDPVDYDYYMAAGRTINAGAGDCDDHCIIICSMLNSIGFRTGARICSPDGSSWHIYAVVGVRPFNNPSAIVPMDTTQTESYPGWEPPMPMRRYELQTSFVLGKPQTLLVNRWNGRERGGVPASKVREAVNMTR